MARPRSQLLVEGPDDYHFFGHFCVQRGRPLGWKDSRDQSQFAFEIHPCGGYPDILDVLKQWIRDIECPQVGIVCDADLVPADRWHALRHILEQQGYSPPQMPDPAGTIVPHPDDQPTVGVWIMPDNQLPGMLEHFAEFLVPDSDGNPSWLKAGDVVSRLTPAEHRFAANDRQKAIVHTWLAWQEEPGTPLGQAVTKRYLDPQLPLGNLLADWLLCLSEPVAADARIPNTDG